MATPSTREHGTPKREQTMKKDAKNPIDGIEQVGAAAESRAIGSPDPNGSESVPESDGDMDEQLDLTSEPVRRIAGLLRIIGWQSNTDRDLTEAEAELIFEVAETESMTEEELSQLRNGVLRQRFGTTAMPVDPPSDGSTSEEVQVTQLDPRPKVMGDGTRTLGTSDGAEAGPMKRELAKSDQVPEGLKRERLRLPRDAPVEATHIPIPTTADFGSGSGLVAFLKHRSGARLSGLAKGLDMDAGFLTDLSDHIAVVPEHVRHEIARRANKGWGIAESETLQALASSEEAPLQRAASRSTAFGETKTAYESIVRRSKMSEDDVRFWLSLA
jgi:hypothetical protein